MDLISLNENLYDEFFVQELESRLETDPLLVGGLLDFSQESSVDGCVFYCGIDGDCFEDCFWYD
ncbi:MAG: hypothetical protein LBE13_05195 [Bacteroidales bacterium]|nr:hypothetical protein [Bacteroidales bacterium]